MRWGSLDRTEQSKVMRAGWIDSDRGTIEDDEVPTRPGPEINDQAHIDFVVREGETHAVEEHWSASYDVEVDDIGLEAGSAGPKAQGPSIVAGPRADIEEAGPGGQMWGEAVRQPLGAAAQSAVEHGTERANHGDSPFGGVEASSENRTGVRPRCRSRSMTRRHRGR